MNIISDSYNLEDGVVSSFLFHYSTVDNRNKKKNINELVSYSFSSGWMIQTEAKTFPHPLTIDDISPIKAGTFVEKDVSCDSQFMKTAMLEVGTAIHEKMMFLPATMTIYLQIDNAGGHGT